MKRAVSVALLLLFTLSPSPPRVQAQDRGLSVVAKAVTGNANFEVGRQLAVIIGIDTYQDWTPLKGAVAEAQKLKQVLADGYYMDQFFELYNRDANAANIRRLFTQTLPAVVGIHDSLLVFYAGHGHLDSSKSGFWIPVDGGTDEFTQDRWLPNSQLRNYIGQLKAQRILVVADSCFSGDLLNTNRGAVPTVDSAYYRRALQLTSRQVLSSGSSETVPDDSEFARQLLGYLERNTEPLVDALSMYERIRKGVTQTLPLFGTLPGNESGASFVLFRKPTGAEPLVVADQVQTAPLPVPQATKGPQRISVETLGDDATRLSDTLKQTLTQAGYVITEAAGLKLAARSQFTLLSPQGELSQAQQILSLTLTRGTEEVGVFTFSGKAVGTSDTSARNRTYNDLASQVKSGLVASLGELVSKP